MFVAASKNSIVRFTVLLIAGSGGLWGRPLAGPAAAGIRPFAVAQGVKAVKLVLTTQADVSGAFGLNSKAQRGQYVYNALTNTARQSQPALLQAISQMGLIGTGYYIANFVMVLAPAGTTISTTQLQELQARPEVQTIESVNSFNPKLPSANAPPVGTLPPGRGIEKNLQFINAPAVWAQGGSGQGVTVGVVDTGFAWDHPLLKTQYRGMSAKGVDHNFNWWDAVHASLTSGTNPCGVNLQEPCDDFGHGTHVAGAALGGNGKDYQIGVAPDARLMGCRDMDRGYASTGATFEECMQFMLAPWDLNGQNADVTKAPDVVVHPYHCYAPGASCIDDPVMNMVYWNLYAAGITSVVAAEDSGPACGGAATWPQVYPIAIVTGALDFDPASGSPSSVIAGYSAMGAQQGTIFKPDIASPGTQILSATPGGNVATMSGTSVAASQLAGAFALILSARPALQGKPEQMWRLIGTVPPQPVESGACGSPAASPNFIYGWGNLDVSVMLGMASAN